MRTRTKGPAEFGRTSGPPPPDLATGGPAPHWAKTMSTASPKEIRRRLGDLVTRLADEVHRDGADIVKNPYGTGISSLTGHLGLLLAGATAPNLATVRPEVAGFGSHVRVKDLGTGEMDTYHLMASEAMDLDQDHVSLESPLGAALLGRGVGSIVDVRTPVGLRRLKVMAVRSLLDLLETLDPQEGGLLAGAER